MVFDRGIEIMLRNERLLKVFNYQSCHHKPGAICYMLKTDNGSQNFFPFVISPDHRRNEPGAWTQTLISAWLVSVPIVFVLRNDH